MKYLLLGFLITGMLASTGCKNPAASSNKPVKTSTNKVKTTTKPVGKTSTRSSSNGDSKSAPTAKQPVGQPSPKTFTKEILANAYVEIYCARQSGRTEGVFELFKKYGFDNPQQWGTAWKTAAKDTVWIAKLNQRATALCPPPKPAGTK